MKRFDRIAVKFSFLVSLLILFIMSVMSRLILDQARASFMNEMEIKAEFFARNAREALFPEQDKFRLYFAAQEMAKEKAIIYALVQDNEGRIISHSQKNRIGELDISPVGLKAAETRNILRQDYRDANGNAYYDIAAPILVGQTRKAGTVRIGFSSESVSGALAPAAKRVTLITIFMLVTGIIGTIVVVMLLVNPIKKLSSAAREVGKGNLNQKVETNRKDELGQLAKNFNEMIDGLKERDFIRNTFGKYVSEQVADAVLRGDLKLGGERRKVTILLSDIRNFTAMSEKLRPEEVVEFLNQYLSKMVDVVIKYDGTVDKFIGDAIFSVFGAPLAYLDDARRAIKVACEMRDKLREFNEHRRDSGHDELKIGIAIHTGDVIAGNIGSEQRLEYTVIGDTVNTAERIERLNKEWGTEILISESTYELVKGEINVREMPKVKLKGKENEIVVYELLGIKDESYKYYKAVARPDKKG